MAAVLAVKALAAAALAVERAVLAQADRVVSEVVLNLGILSGVGLECMPGLHALFFRRQEIRGVESEDAPVRFGVVVVFLGERGVVDVGGGERLE